MLKINDWYLTTAKYVTSATYIHKIVTEKEYNKEDDCVVFDITDLSDPETTEIYSSKSVVADNATGNTIEFVGTFDDYNTGSYFTLGIDDGELSGGFNIYKGRVVSLDGGVEAEIPNETGECKYTITLKDGVCTLLFNTTELVDYTVTTPSENKRLYIGFANQTGKAKLRLKYLKRTVGAYKYISVRDIDFELQIDSAPTFDTINLHTYTKEDFFTNQENSESLKAFAPVSFVCGTHTADGYLFDSIVQAATVHMPPKQPENLTYYARVRFVGKYTSDYSNCYLLESVKSTELEKTQTSRRTNIGEHIVKEITESEEGYLAVKPLESDYAIVLPDIISLHNNWTLELYNAGDYPIAVYDFVGNRLGAFDKKTITNITFDSVNNRWFVEQKDKQISFIVPADITNIVFDAVFNHHIPAFDEVYTKELNSGNVADFVRAQSHEISEVFSHIVDQTQLISWKTANIDDLTKRWGNIFNLDKSLFKNNVEMRDALQLLISKLPIETLKKTIEQIIFGITGAMPTITEYKDKYFNIIWDDATRRTLPIEDQYFLYDDEEPSIIGNPFVLYGESDQCFTWQIDVFDPYNLNYNKDLIRQILYLIKPAHTYVIPCFYNVDGILLKEKYNYGYSNYNNISYNK